MTAVENFVSFKNENLSGKNQFDELKHSPIFPKATVLLFNSGNVASSDRLRKRTNLSPEDEVHKCCKQIS